MRLLTTGNLQPLLLRISSSNTALSSSSSQQFQQQRNLTDIQYYKCVEYSHLHIWESQSARRKFLVKLEQLEKEKAARSQKLHNSSKLQNPANLKPIKLPQYVERKPSEILRVLASAVKRDPTAAHYKYHDDPYLIPYNSMTKRDFIMSKEGGKKAARYVLDHHPELFLNNLIEAQPPIKAFMPKSIITEKNASLELLQSYVEGFDVAGSIQVYKMLIRKKISIDVATKRQLLDLVCYHNEREEMSENHGDTAGVIQVPENPWYEGNVAEEIYQDITSDKKATPDELSAANLAILYGMAKHRQRKEAWIYYEMTKDVKSLARYNAGISCLPIASDDFFQNWESAKQILSEMAQEGIKPNEITLMNLLGYIRLISIADKDYSNGCKLALSVLAEFKAIGVLPSLGAYKELTNIYITQNKRSFILLEIIKELEKRLDQTGGSLLSMVVDVEDFKFFRNSMDKCGYRLRNLQVAYKIHSLLTRHDDHQVLLGDYLDVNSYYRHFLTTIMHREPLNVTMEYVSHVVPHVFTPNSQFYHDLVREIQIQSAFQYLPKVWMDLQVGDFCSVSRPAKFDLMVWVADVVAQADLEATGLQNLRDSFVRIANDIFNELSTTVDYKQYPLTANKEAVALCNCTLSIALTHNDLPLAMKIVAFCRQEVTRLVGNIDGDLLEKFIDAMISNEEKSSAVDCVIYAAEQRMPRALVMGQKLMSAFSLDDVEMNRLNLLFAHEIEWTKHN